ncbi:MAG: agmatine deiminase family protein, partial [Bacteroidota bacterium]
MKKIFTFLFAAVFTTVIVYGQQPLTNQSFQGKYHMLDSSELYSPLIKSKSFTPTAPPAGSVRSIPEWEPTEAVLVAYPGSFGIPYALIAELSQDCKVITIVESSGQQTTVTNNYNSNGVNMANCSFYIAALDSYWIRDYGPWFIMVDNTEVAIVDFPYNRPSRPNDDEVPVEMAGYLGVDLYGMDIMHTGGNYMSDGMGIAASTDLVTDENTLTVSQINTLVDDFLGVTNYYITADPLGDYIKHIDCWGKFLDVDKILIASVPVTNAQYSEYEAMATYWENEVSSYGNNYQVYRVYEPNGQPYTNSYICNKKVVIPYVTGTGSTQNSVALSVYQQAMPGYEVIGFTQLSAAPWESTDAMHCRVHEVADRQMLYVHHLPLLNEQTDQSQYLISADVYALSGGSLVNDSMFFRYSVNQGIWNKIMMTNSGGNTWQGNIPQQTPGDTVEYYIHASDNSPKSITHPLIGSPDPHKFWIAGTVDIAGTPVEKTLIFPNPANDYLFVFLRNQQDATGFVKIFDSMGTLVKQIDLADYPDKFMKLDV